MDGKIAFAPVKDPKRILDCGTGTGIWSIEMADKYPAAVVIGSVDLWSSHHDVLRTHVAFCSQKRHQSDSTHARATELSIRSGRCREAMELLFAL